MRYAEPPEAIRISGKEYPIDTDFRLWIQLSDSMTGKTDDEVFKAVRDFTAMQGLPISSESFSAVLAFYACGETESRTSNSIGKPKERAFDFYKDEEMICSAFRTQYGIDLRRDSLHWWDFLALFKGLKSDIPIVEIMGYRTVDLSKCGKEQRKHYEALKNKYSLDTVHYKSLEDRNEALKARIRRIHKEVNKNG